MTVLLILVSVACVACFAAHVIGQICEEEKTATNADTLHANAIICSSNFGDPNAGIYAAIAMASTVQPQEVYREEMVDFHSDVDIEVVPEPQPELPFDINAGDVVVEPVPSTFYAEKEEVVTISEERYPVYEQYEQESSTAYGMESVNVESEED